MSERKGPEIIKRLSSEEEREELMRLEAELEINLAELDAKREDFYSIERLVSDKVDRINHLRSKQHIEPMPDPLLRDLSGIKGEQPEGLRALNRRILETERTAVWLQDAASEVARLHQDLIKQKNELLNFRASSGESPGGGILGGQETQDFIDQESRPDQSL